MREIIKSQWFALVDLLLVIVGGAIWIFKPELGLWSILIALLPWILRIISGDFPFRRTSFDWLIAIFLATAWVGYWASYDEMVAWSKVWLIVVAVLLYYSIASQPQENLVWVSGFFFCIGVGVAIYFFLTHDFVSLPRKLKFVNDIGLWIMKIRPGLDWTPIHPNYVAGVIAITVPFIFYPIWKLNKNITSPVVLFYGLITVGFGLSLFAFVMATSRGVIMAVVSAGGVWFLWKIVSSSRVSLRFRREAIFPSLILLYLVVALIFLYMGPARSESSISGQDQFGTGSRAELFSRSIYLVKDFPLTGGGLGSFPGLFSQYILNIPFYSLPNAHNIFLDVFIEQGLLGGLSYLLMYIAGIWMTTQAMAKAQSPEMQVFRWLGFFALVTAFVHGMVDDYLYYKDGAFLSLFLIGIASNGIAVDLKVKKVSKPMKAMILPSAIVIIFLVLLLLNYNKIRSSWYANLGAVEMAKVELMDFPANEWVGEKHVSDLTTVQESLLSSLQFDPHNQTANYHLGLIGLARQDFSSTLGYLLEAHRQSPHHRGIVKSLGYCYLWLGDMDNARLLLQNIPEAKSELDVYVWWWWTQGRDDLSENASVMSSVLSSSSVQQ